MIAPRLLDWFDRHGRHDLPWQHPRSAYRVWLAEIMLQQTQVATVIPYFRRFVTALPTLRALAAADEDSVLALWSGLGYYRRARMLHAAAKCCVQRHHGRLPRNFDDLVALPGIGRSTAGAILAQAHGLPFPILDGNVKRVLSRHRGIRGHPGQATVERELWRHAAAVTPTHRVADYTQAIMDLGATVCTRTQPRCDACPLAADCVARREHLTAVLPERRAPRTLPTRRTVMLLLRDARQRVLLEKRGPQGVWAGLWSLPEAPDTRSASRHVARYARAGRAKPLAPFVHTFSHYRLRVTPLVYAHARHAPAVAEGQRTRWCTRADAGALGIPAPVRTLLDEIWSASQGNE